MTPAPMHYAIIDAMPPLRFQIRQIFSYFSRFRFHAICCHAVSLFRRDAARAALLTREMPCRR
jgi:hypothetical protein